MKIILQREVDKLGAPGDVVDVADGYARNFLIPRKLAVPATRGGVKHADTLKQAHQARVLKSLQEARTLAEKLEATRVRIGARAGEDGRLFGSITGARVAEELEKAAGVPIDRRRVDLPDPIRSVGTHEIGIQLNSEVTASVTVDVVAE
ncbi:MAG TPA: 50S ribosomal protein L9 [Actinomycetota bacterium]